MKTCPNCGAQMQDDSLFCTACGTRLEQQEQNQQEQQQQQSYRQQPPYQQPMGGYAYTPPYDHTAEFDAKDISDNKVLAMLCYLTGTIGIIIALLGSNRSAYAAFHVRQALKFTVLNILLAIIGSVLLITFIVPIACAICMVILWVVKIICFFYVCGGKAKEPPIVRSLGFLR